MIPFRPLENATVNIDVSASSQRVKVANCNGRISVRVMNNGTVTAWIASGDVTVTTAVGTGIPVAAGGTEVLTLEAPQADALYIAAIAAGSTGKIHFTPGIGI